MVLNIFIPQRDGLGNQIFRLAAGLYFQEELGAKLTLLAHRPKNTRGVSRPFQLDNFNIGCEIRNENISDRLILSEKSQLNKISGLARRLQRSVVFRQSSPYCFESSTRFIGSVKSVYAHGYWQNAAYANAMEKSLRRRLQLRNALPPPDDQILSLIRAAKMPVSVHFRGGDYRLSKSTRVLSAEYYRTAVDIIKCKFDNPIFFIFSDDFDFATSLLPPGLNCINVSHNNEQSAFLDLYLMSNCRHHIISNSTFAWWGAWLNEQDKIVIAPKRWTGTDQEDFSCLFEKTWLLLNTL
jgi:hypothetical protein